MLKKRFFSLVLASVLILSFVFSSVIVSAQGGGTTIFLPAIFKQSTLTVATFFDPGQNLSPYFSRNTYNDNIVNLTQLHLLTLDRQGMVVKNAIAGETRPFNGKPYTYTGPADIDIEISPTTGDTLYIFTLRSDLKFADGLPVSADDLIFTLYTYLDPSYDGSNALKDLPILGLQDYHTQTTPEIYEKYENFYTSIHDSGKDHVWDSSDPWTQDQQTDVWNRLEEALAIEVEKIVDYVVSNYTDGYAEAWLGFSPEEVYANEGLQVAFGMRMWGFANVNTSTKVMTANCSSRTWNLNYEYPTLSDYADEIMLCYNNNYREAFPYESADGTDVYSEVKEDFILYWGPLDPDMIGGIPNISGIQKISDVTVSIEIKGFEPASIYSVDVPITPLHYYGSTNKYDYALNMFGFDFGDLSLQHSKDNAPMGAGPYQFASKQGDVIYLGANRYHYEGEPKINQIKFVESLLSPQLQAAINSGSIDLAEFSYNRQGIEEIYNINSNGELTGDVITTSKIENLGYGYIGINALTVKVGNDITSLASRNLRKALSTILAVHRKPAIEAYYGPDGASVLEYPSILTSWASPQPGDSGYHDAFSMDVNGNPIYVPGMSQEERIIAAKLAALGFFEAAGFTVFDRVVVAAPTGAKLNYEVIVPGGGTGSHPAFAILTGARDTLYEIGITLNIFDTPDANDLWDALDSGTQELWVAAWGSTIDPDLFQVYHSSNTFDQPGSKSNHYYIQDPRLDALIIQARSSDDQAFRKQLYQEAFDIIMDWGVEIPAYNRKNFTIFSSQRVNTSTITPDITTFWNWQHDIEDMKMK